MPVCSKRIWFFILYFFINLPVSHSLLIFQVQDGWPFTNFPEQWLGWPLVDPRGHGHEYALRRASREIRANREAVLAAVAQGGWNLEYASEELRRDPEVALTAVKNTGSALQHVPAELQEANKAIVIAALESPLTAWMYVSEALRGDADIVIAAIKGDELDVHFLKPATLYANKEVLLAAVAKDGCAIIYADEYEDVQLDSDVVIAAELQLWSKSPFVTSKKNDPYQDRRHAWAGAMRSGAGGHNGNDLERCRKSVEFITEWCYPAIRYNLGAGRGSS